MPRRQTDTNVAGHLVGQPIPFQVPRNFQRYRSHLLTCLTESPDSRMATAALRHMPRNMLAFPISGDIAAGKQRKLMLGRMLHDFLFPGLPAASFHVAPELNPISYIESKLEKRPERQQEAQLAQLRTKQTRGEARARVLLEIVEPQ
jgi:hypothetical protein